MQGEPPSSIERALGLLELLLEQPQGAELTDLVKRLDISRSSLFVLLGTLKRLGYVEQSERRGRYRAGPRLLAWRGQATPAADLQMAFYQEAGASGISETLALALPLNNEVILVAQVESSEQYAAFTPPVIVLDPTAPCAGAHGHAHLSDSTARVCDCEKRPEP